MSRRGMLYIGTSGYVYQHWRRRFYPPDVPARAWLAFYARHFATVELNNPFYRLPEAAVFEAWRLRAGGPAPLLARAPGAGPAREGRCRALPG